MPEPDLYRPLIGMSVRLTERLTSRLPNVYRSRSTTPGRLTTKINIVTATGSLTGQRSVPGHRSPSAVGFFTRRLFLRATVKPQ